jgi:hypothetical protein
LGGALPNRGKRRHGRSLLAAETSPKRTEATVADAIVALRRQRLTSKHIARETAVSEVTVSRVLARAGLSRLKDLEPVEPVRRYEREHPGELIHLDIKKLGRIGSVGAPHHRTTSWRGQPSSRHRLGVRPRLYRRCLARRPDDEDPRAGRWVRPADHAQADRGAWACVKPMRNRKNVPAFR